MGAIRGYEWVTFFFFFWKLVFLHFQVHLHQPLMGFACRSLVGSSSVASPIFQERQSERTFPILALSSRFFFFFSIFSQFSSLFPNFSPLFWFLTIFFAVKGGTLPPLPLYWLCHWWVGIGASWHKYVTNKITKPVSVRFCTLCGMGSEPHPCPTLFTETPF